MHPDELAARRHKNNQFSRTNKPLTSDADQIGLAGELAFAELIGIDHKPASAAPTRGYQFNLGPNKKIKVLTSRTPGNLFVKEGKVLADVYVLAGVTGDPIAENVYFVGWMHASGVRDAPVRTPTHKADYIQPAHAVPRDDLLGMKYLMHGLDLNPDHLLRFPLSINGHIEVEAHKPQESPKPTPEGFMPLPPKRIKA